MVVVCKPILVFSLSLSRAEQLWIDNVDMWSLMGRNCQNFFVYPIISTIFSKNCLQGTLACLQLFPCLSMGGDQPFLVEQAKSKE